MKNNNNETVHSLIKREPIEIKRWLQNIVNTEIDYKEKFNDFNILLLRECVNDKYTKAEHKSEAIEWFDLEIFIYSILKEMRQKESFSYDSSMMSTRLFMITKFGEDGESDIFNVSLITDWIDIDSITIEKIKDLKEKFHKTKDISFVLELHKIKVRLSMFKNLVANNLVPTNPNIDILYSYIKSNNPI